MELKFVIPNMAKSLGNLEFGGPAEVKRGDTRRNGTQTKVLYRRYKLFSDVQRADDIEVVIDGAGRPEAVRIYGAGQAQESVGDG